MEVRFYVTNKCNLRCDYCLVDKDNVPEVDNRHLLFRELERLKKENVRVRKLFITGGETSLKPEMVFDIIEKCQYLERIIVVSNGTNLDFCRKVNQYENVVLGVSWDGPNNERDFNAIDTIKVLVNEFPDKLPIISYVIENNNYTRVTDDMRLLESVHPRLVDTVEVAFVRNKKSYYKMDLDKAKTELERLIREYPHLPIFKRLQDKTCPHLDSTAHLVNIDQEGVRYGCTKFVYIDHNVCDQYKKGCMVCDIDNCYVCVKSLESLCGEGVEVDPENPKYLDNMFCKYNRVMNKVMKDRDREMFFESKLGRVQYVELVLTDTCNLDCVYCTQGCHSGKKEFMSDKTLDGAIELIKMNYKFRNSWPTIKLFGGEPIYSGTVGIVNNLLDKLESLGIGSKIDLVTNLYQFDDKIENLYKRMVDTGRLRFVQVSLDPKAEEKPSRLTYSGEDSRSKVIENLHKLSKIIGYDKINVHTVVSDENVACLPDHILELRHLINERVIRNFGLRMARIDSGYRKIEVTHVSKYAFTDVINLYKEGKITKSDIRAVFNLHNYKCNNASYFNDNICGMMKNFVSISPKGEIIPCNNFLFSDDYSQYVYGDVSEGKVVFTDNIYNMYDMFDVENRRRCEYKSCECCVAFETCFSCRAENIRHRGNMNMVSPQTCYIHKERFKVLKNNLNLEDFRLLTDEEINKLKADIKELRTLYDDPELTQEEKEAINEVLLDIKNRLE